MDFTFSSFQRACLRVDNDLLLCMQCNVISIALNYVSLFLQLCDRKRQRVMETGSGSQLWSDQDPRAALNFLLDKVGGRRKRKTPRPFLSRRRFFNLIVRVSDSSPDPKVAGRFLV